MDKTNRITNDIDYQLFIILITFDLLNTILLSCN